MTDIVERLRERKANWMEALAVMEAAANEIERLRQLIAGRDAEIKELQTAHNEQAETIRRLRHE